MTQVIIQDKKGQDRYQIKKRGSERTLCYELFKWREESVNSKGIRIEAGFVSLRSYPSTLSHAYRMIAEDIIRDENIKLFAKTAPVSLRKAGKEIEDVLDSFGIQIIK